MSGASFCDLFCAARACTVSEFEERVFWECVYPQGDFVARLVWRLHRACFEADLELIRAAGELMSVSDLKTEISNFRYHHPARGFLRGTLKVRISGQILLDLAVKLFRTAR